MIALSADSIVADIIVFDITTEIIWYKALDHYMHIHYRASNWAKYWRWPTFMGHVTCNYHMQLVSITLGGQPPKRTTIYNSPLQSINVEVHLALLQHPLDIFNFQLSIEPP